MCTTSLHFHRVACRYRGLIGRLLIVVTILLAPTISMAQQPAPTPTLAPGEFVASKPEDIVGIWKTRIWSAVEVAYMQYNADGTYILASTLEALENDYGTHGTFWFEGTVFHVKDYGDEGIYEIRVKTEGDTRVHLSFRLINDSNRTRGQDYERGMPRFNPSRASEEFVASKPEDIVGIWETRFMGEVAYMRYNPDGTSTLASKLEALENDYGRHETFWFEGTVFHIEEKNSQGTGTYEVRVKTEGDTRVYLSFRVIDDPNRGRARDYTRGMPRFDLSLQASE